MSIYALPGPLYKLISSGASTKSSRADAESACSSKDTITTSSASNPTTSSSAASNPLLRRTSSGSLPGSQPLGDSSEHNSSQGRNSNGNVKLAVTEAKIDPERLIRSLSLKPDPKKAAAKALASSEGPSDDASKAAAPSSNSSSQPRRRRSRKSDRTIKPADHESSDCERQCDPHEDAIKFEISVSFNGREYTATRTLPRILQFRYDLIEEISARRMWRERRRKRKGASKPPEMAKVRDLSDDEDESSQDGSIPELPRLSEDAAGSSGFTMLNALLRPYGPALERWLHSVIDIVPHDSQCLTQFLWEPLAGQATSCKERRGSYERRSSSMSTLGAIQETDDLDQYDSDTDNYLLNH